MKISEKGLNLIKEFEGLRFKAYFCPAGILTIGYGHVILPQDKLNQTSSISEAEADAFLKRDVERFEKAVNRRVKTLLSQGQFDALVSFTFNLGEGNLKKSTLLRLINAREFDLAADEFGQWVYAKGKKLEGLVRRRKAERDLFVS